MYRTKVVRAKPIGWPSAAPSKPLNSPFKSPFPPRHYSNTPLKHAPGQRQRRYWIGGSVFVLGTVLYYTNDEFRRSTRHSVLTLKRIGVVTVAVARCFWLYGKVLRFDSFADELQRQEALRKVHLKAAQITLKALETNGGVYIKLGQHVSAMTYLLPPEWTDTMIPLQQKCPQSSLEEINEMFLRDLGQSVAETFSEFDPDPIGVLSLLQVHVATLRESGEKVLVKCQHPLLQEFVPIDVQMTQTVFELMLKVFPEYPLTWLGEELQSSIYVELDFVNELVNSRKTAEYFAAYQKQTLLRIPKILQLNHRILIMEFVAGARLDDLHYMDEHHISRAEVSSCLSHIFNNMIFTPNVGVHCDPHGGNLLIRECPEGGAHNFEIVLYDHGLYREIPDQMRRDYARFWLLLLDKDVEEMERHAKLFAGISHEQFPILAAAITGRDFKHLLGGEVTERRSEDEIGNMTDALVKEGKILDLMSLLSSLPRIVLLILKTNDLTRRLDEDLDNPLGLHRTFFILAQYCAKTVLQDDLERNRQVSGWRRLVGLLRSYWTYFRRVDELFWYDLAVWLKSKVKY